MKKVLVFSVLLWVTLFFVGCNNKEEDKTTASTNSNPEYEELCSNNGGVLQIWDEGWENAAVCFYSDNTFCFVEDVLSGNCDKWDIPFYNDNYDVNSELMEKSDFKECDAMEEEIVCGKDWNTYSNKCYMEASGVEQETELAKVVDGKCLFE